MSNTATAAVTEFDDLEDETSPGAGHNSGGEVGGVTAQQLRAYIERWERLEEEKKAIAQDQKEVMAEAKAEGFDTKIMREVIKLRKMDSQDRLEQRQLIDLYWEALGL